MERIVKENKEMNESNLIAAAASLATDHPYNQTVVQACEAVREMTRNVYRLGKYKIAFYYTEDSIVSLFSQE